MGRLWLGLERSPGKKAEFARPERRDCRVRRHLLIRHLQYMAGATWRGTGIAVHRQSGSALSIAIMFWFAGLIGMGMETKIFNRWLGAQVLRTTAGHRFPAVGAATEPASYAASFNPSPSVVIGVVSSTCNNSGSSADRLSPTARRRRERSPPRLPIPSHDSRPLGTSARWLRPAAVLTYFFLYVAPPPVSVLPGRPPTEAMAAILLACGGVVFVLSDKEVTFAAIRHGWDDMMAILNWVSPIRSSMIHTLTRFDLPVQTVAAVCLLFCWVERSQSWPSKAGQWPQCERPRRGEGEALCRRVTALIELDVGSRPCSGADDIGR